MLRLRQVALVATDLEPTVADLCQALGVEICFRDPGVGEFGLVNALVAVGDQLLEVVSPMREGTTAGRLLDKRGGDGGYMVILQCDDLDRRRARFDELGVRVVWRHDSPHVRGTHLHPRDVGGAIVSVDWADPPESWPWAGPSWQQHIRTGTVSGIAGVEIGADDPTAMAARWAEVIDAPLDGTTVRLDDAELRFVPAGPRGAGVDGLDLVATDRARAGHEVTICGTRLRFV